MNRASPPSANFLHFHTVQSLGKNWPNNRLASPFSVNAPHVGCPGFIPDLSQCLICWKIIKSLYQFLDKVCTSFLTKLKFGYNIGLKSSPNSAPSKINTHRKYQCRKKNSFETFWLNAKISKRRNRSPDQSAQIKNVCVTITNCSLFVHFLRLPLHITVVYTNITPLGKFTF